MGQVGRMHSSVQEGSIPARLLQAIGQMLPDAAPFHTFFCK